MMKYGMMRKPHHRRWLHSLLVWVLVVTSVLPAATAGAAEPVTDYVTTVAASESQVQPGQAVGLTASITAAVSRSVLVDLEVFGPNGARVFQMVENGLSLTAGETKSIPFEWKLEETLPEGKYTVSIGIFKPDWGVQYAWHAGAAVITVSKAAGPSVSTSVTVTPSAVRAGEPVEILAKASSSTTLETLVEIQLRSAEGAVVAHQEFPNRTLNTGMETLFPLAWNVPAAAPAGQYAVEMSVLSPDRTVTYVDRSKRAVINVLPATANGEPGGKAEYTSSATATPSQAAPGEKVDLKVEVSSTKKDTVLVDAEIYSPTGEKVHQQFLDLQELRANQVHTYPMSWQVPAGAAEGDYTVRIGLFKPGWGKLYHWNSQAAVIKVQESADVTPPAIPAGLSAAAGDSKVSLTWQPVGDSDLEDYKVYISHDGGSTWSSAKPTGKLTSYTAEGLTNGVAYTFAVTATDVSGNESAKSVPVQATPSAPASSLPAPTGIQVHYAGETSRVVSWSAVENPAVAGYKVYVSEDRGITWRDPIDNGLMQFYMVNGLVSGRGYTFAVTAYESNGSESAKSVLYHVFIGKPQAPEGLTAQPLEGAVKLSWNAVTNNSEVTNYRVYVSMDGGATWGYGQQAGNETSYTMTGLTNGTVYAFAVTAMNNRGEESDRSTPVQATPQGTPPAIPQGLTASAGDALIKLQWTAVTDADLAGYKLYLSQDNGNSWSLGAETGKVTEYTLTGLTNNVEYAVAISAVDGNGNESARSAVVKATPNNDDIVPPAAPTSLKATAKDSAAILHWKAGTEPDLSGYQVYMSQAAEGPWSLQASIQGTAYYAGGLTNGTTYYVAVKAVDQSGNASELSAPVAVSPKAPVIPADPAASAPQLSATGTTSFADATDFLYQGSSPVQFGVEPGALDEARMSVLRGKVQDRAGAPLSGVTIQVLNESKLGHTVSRADGAFDLVINGGATVTLQYEKLGYLTVQRKATVPWNDYLTVPDVAMTPYDSNVTEIQLSGAAGIQVAQGSPVTDADGSRQATLLFTPGTTAQMKLIDGTLKELPALHVRATEYTVGENGLKAMPGELPANVGYTYAVELSVDEAVAAGATEVRFNQPVPVYVDNFLQFPTGTVVPLGYYDYKAGGWIPSQDGIVIKVLSVNGGVASIDANGDELPDSEADLASLGITAEEQAKLAALYPAGKSLWRVTVKHFTPWDANWPYGPPEDSENPPQQEDEWKDKFKMKLCNKQNSIIGCQDQTLGETIPIEGSALTLNYQSKRTPGYMEKSRITVPVTKPTFKPSTFIRSVEVKLHLAGRTIEKSFPAFPNQTFEYDWDGKDVYGRDMIGDVRYSVDIRYVYQAQYYAMRASSGGSSSGAASSFGRVAGVKHVLMNRSLNQITLGETWSGSVLSPINPYQETGIAGWSLDNHHMLLTDELLKGDGTSERKRAAVGQEINFRGRADVPGSLVLENGRNTETGVIGPDGQYYFVKKTNDWPWGYSSTHTFYRVDHEGAVRELFSYEPNTYLEVPNYPDRLAVGTDGTIYAVIIKETIMYIVRRSPGDSDWTVIAGGQPSSGIYDPIPDGTHGLQAKLHNPYRLRAGADGSLYFLDGNALHKLNADGYIMTYNHRGSRFEANPTDDGRATPENIGRVNDFQVGSDGSIYLLDIGGRNSDESRIRVIHPDGTMSKLIGKAFTDAPGEVKVTNIMTGVKPEEAVFHTDRIYVSPVGVVYFKELEQGVFYKINLDGFIEEAEPQVFLGMAKRVREEGYDQSGRVPMQLFGIGPNGELYVRITLKSTLPTGESFYHYRVKEGVNAILPDETGTVAYELDKKNGRHLTTRSGYTGQVLMNMEYDPAGRLIAMRDPFGNVTTIVRDSAGKPEEIIAPNGQRTQLKVENGQLVTVTHPGGKTHKMVYDDKGLLKQFTDTSDYVRDYGYTPRGMLIRAENPKDGVKQLEAIPLENGVRVQFTNPDGKVTQYETYPGDKSMTTATIEPTGEKTSVVHKLHGPEETTFPDGSKLIKQLDADPRWGMDVPVVRQFQYTTPKGQVSHYSETRKAVLANSLDPFSLQSLTIQNKTGNDVYTVHYDRATHSILETSPEGLQRRTYMDAYDRVTKQEEVGQAIAPVLYEYNEKGLLKRKLQGDQYLDYTYDAFNRLETVTDAYGAQKVFGYDGLNRITSVKSPEGKLIRQEYDDNSNLTGVITANGDRYRQDFDQDDLYVGFRQEGAATGITIQRSLDGDMQQSTLRSGRVVQYKQETDTGRIHQVIDPDVSRTYSYFDGDSTDRVRLIESVTSSTYGATVTGAAYGLRQAIEFTYDGDQVQSAAWSGQANGRFGYQYDSQFRLTNISTTVTGSVYGGTFQANAALNWNKDNQLIQYGKFYFDRTGPGKRVGTIRDDRLQVGMTYDNMGRVKQMQYTLAGKEVYLVDHEYDVRSLLIRKTVTTSEGSDVYVYEYDKDHQLRKVTRSGVSGVYVEAYDYDDNKNRRSREVTGAEQQISTYGSYDLLKQIGQTEYQFDIDGYLTQRGGDTFRYGVKGELLEATVQGETIRYAYDGIGRRTSREDASGKTQYLYGDVNAPLTVTATVNAAGVVTLYQYDERGLLLGLEREGSSYYIVSDQVGTPLQVLDAEGTVVKAMRYDSFGVLLSDSNPAFELEIGYAGGLKDEKTKLLRFGARDYDPASGRWTAIDPILFEGRQANLYAYVGNNPVTLRDTCGLFCIGASYYQGVGGGARFCIDKDGFGACAEAGFGVGAGVEVSPTESIPNSGVTLEATVKIKGGPASVTLGVQGFAPFGTGCREVKLVDKFSIGSYEGDLTDPTKSKAKTKKLTDKKFQSPADAIRNGKPGFGFEAALKAKGCYSKKW
ncbi:fibronectin type III domain-containing protein [Paenibacillus sp. GD4]|uniref:fibronectin type III domain-containing protein n=1 Tax=Paenibacillus sp. GD4 TaxID=3068890 RepID=UPI002796BA51|nr:fibronectin type III domain-containing protein [Paenibacillus sp. GD4]MDQ1914625.1 fibronectin type III domain-containing protein [Paenibacillus sp. GD4]